MKRNRFIANLIVIDDYFRD